MLKTANLMVVMMGRSRKQFYAGLFVLLCLGGLLFQFGRSLWYPVYVKMSGGRSVAAVVAHYQASAPDVSAYEGLLILGLKAERSLEVWGQLSDDSYRLITSYPFTGFSGQLGPKLREGDGQIPEGIYRIEYLNPNSSYHLSMKIDYPNAFDRAKAEADGRSNLGYDIFIHGKSATIGCVPIGDSGIEELFSMVAEVGTEHVEVILAPYDMRTSVQLLEVEGIDWEQELYGMIRTAIDTKLPQ